MPDPKGAGLHAASLSAVAFRNGSWPLPTAVVELERTRVEPRRPLISLWFEVRVLPSPPRSLSNRKISQRLVKGPQLAGFDVGVLVSAEMTKTR